MQFPDGTKFYPDVQNGVRGYNTDPQRGADTFCPFSSNLTIPSITLNGSCNGYRDTSGTLSGSLKLDVKNNNTITFGSVSGSASITLDIGSAQTIVSGKEFDISDAEFITLSVSSSGSNSQSEGGYCAASYSATLKDICIN